MALTVAQLTARLTADTSNFYKSMAIADAAIFRTGSIASRVGAGIGIAVAATGVMALKTAGDFQQSMNILGAVSGSTTKEMKAMQDQAIALGKDMKLPNVSAKDAADAMTELSKAGLSVKDIMGATRGVLQLGVAGNIKFADSATIVARALTSFHMSGTQATRVADLLTATANKTTADVNDMALGIQMASAQFHAAGYDIDDLTTSLGLMANAGIAGSDAGTSLKTMMNRLTAPTDKAKEKMKELGISVYNASGNVKKMPQLIETFNKALKNQSNETRNAALYTIFGSDAIRAARIQLAAGAEGWNLLNQQTTRGGEAQAFAEARTKGFNGAVQGLVSQVETLAIELGQALLPAATAAAQGLANFLSHIDAGKITAFFGFLSDGVRILYSIATANGAATPMLIGMVTALATLNFVIRPIISGIMALRTAVMAFTASLALNPVTMWAMAIGAVAGLLWGFASSSSNAASTSQRLTDAINANAEAFRNFQDAMSNITGADIRYKQALIDRASAQREVKNLEAQGITSGMAYQQATLRLARANLEVRDSGIARGRAIKDSDKVTRDTLITDNNAIRLAKQHRDEAFKLARQLPNNAAATRGAEDAQKKLNTTYNTAIRHGKDYTTEVMRVAKGLDGPARTAFLNSNKWVAQWNIQKAKDKLNDTITFITGKAPTFSQQSQLIGKGIADGIGAGITSAPAVQAAVRAVQEAIAEAKAAAKIKSPSQVANEQVGAPISQGIAQGIYESGWEIKASVLKVLTQSNAAAQIAAITGGKKVGKDYSEAQLRGYVLGTIDMPEKMGKVIKRAIEKAKSIIKAAEPGFSKAFGRLSDLAFQAFDAVTSQHKTPTELLLEQETAARDKAAADAQRQDAQTTINDYSGKVAAVNSMTANEGESEADFQKRKQDELLRLKQEYDAAVKQIDDLNWAQRQADLAAQIEKERMDYEQQRANERLALQDNLDNLQARLLAGKINVNQFNAEVNKIFKNNIPEYRKSGVRLGAAFGAGLAAAKRGIIANATDIAKAIMAILKLNSPAKKGPLSTLDTWWDAFAPTLLEGLDQRGIEKALTKAVDTQGINGLTVATSNITKSPETTINLNVTDQTLAGMSREQADRVARDIKAALDRQVNANF